MSSTVSLQDFEILRSEYEVSENLLIKSQQDNKEKHNLLENHKLYVKDLERLLQASCGQNWKNDHDIAPLATAGTIISASTPLRRPTPSILRHSTSISQINQRSFQAPKRRNSHHIDARLLDSLREVSENLADSTPTAARRRLQDKTVDASGPSDVSDKVGDSVATIRILLDEMDRILMQKELLLSTKTEEARKALERLHK